MTEFRGRWQQSNYSKIRQRIKRNAKLEYFSHFNGLTLLKRRFWKGFIVLEVESRRWILMKIKKRDSIKMAIRQWTIRKGHLERFSTPKRPSTLANFTRLGRDLNKTDFGDSILLHSSDRFRIKIDWVFCKILSTFTAKSYRFNLSALRQAFTSGSSLFHCKIKRF